MMDPKTHIYPHFYAPFLVPITMYPLDTVVEATPFGIRFFLCSFSIPSIVFALRLQLPPVRDPDPVSHSRHFFPPPPCTQCSTRLQLYRENNPAFSSLVDTRRIVRSQVDGSPHAAAT